MNGSRAPFAYQQPIRCEFEKFSCCINLHFSRLNISTLVQNIYTLHKIFPHITKYLHSEQNISTLHKKNPHLSKIFPQLCTKYFNSAPQTNSSSRPRLWILMILQVLIRIVCLGARRNKLLSVLRLIRELLILQHQ